MDTNVVCKVCNQEVDVPTKYVDKNWKCPRCQTRFVPLRQADGKLVASEVEGQTHGSYVEVSSASPAGSPASSPAASGAPGGWGALAVAFVVGMVVGAFLLKMLKG